MRRTLAWGLATLLLVAFGVGQRRYIDNFIHGPYDVGAEDLSALNELAQKQRNFVRVTGSKAVDIGIQQITVRKRGGVETGRSVSGAYYVLVVGDRLLIVKGSTNLPTTVEGEFKRIPPDLDAKVFDTPDMNELRSRFVRSYLDTSSFREPGYWSIGGGLVFFVLLLIFGIPAWKYLKDPSAHPVVQRVNGWGDPIGVAVAAEREYPTPRFKGGSWRVGNTFLIQSTFFTFDVLRLQDLLWAYKVVTRHSWNFIPTGKTYESVLACYGGTASIKTSEITTDEIIAFASQRVPWAIVGFSEELSQFFKKNTNEFCAAVEERKREHHGQPA